MSNIAECELCGRNAPLFRARIEDAVINVCEKCTRLGEKLPEAEKPAARRVAETRIEEVTINPNFADIIAKARQSARLSRQELAEKIKEKLTVIERIERGMNPPVEVARKLEKTLGIKLIGYASPNVQEAPIKKEPLTLGDVVTIVRKKKKT